MRTLYEEMTNESLEEYTKWRCDEIKRLHDNLKEGFIRMASTNSELEKFNILEEMSILIRDLSSEHVNTLDRYLYSYELNKRLENEIIKLKYPNDYEEA